MVIRVSLDQMNMSNVIERDMENGRVRNLIGEITSEGLDRIAHEKGPEIEQSGHSTCT